MSPKTIRSQTKLTAVFGLAMAIVLGTADADEELIEADGNNVSVTVEVTLDAPEGIVAAEAGGGGEAVAEAAADGDPEEGGGGDEDDAGSGGGDEEA